MATPPQKATEAIPLLYRFLLTNIESLCALAGAVMVTTNPDAYVSMTSRALLPAAQPGSHFVYTQLAGAWLFIAFAEAVVLRFCDDVKVWRLVCVGILLSDALYTVSIAQAVGGFAAYVDPALWTVEDTLAAVGTWPFVLTRVAIVLGIGLRTAGGKKKD